MSQLPEEPRLNHVNLIMQVGANREAIQTQKEIVADLSTRVSVIERKIDSLATKAQVKAVARQLNQKIDEEIRGVKEYFNQRIEEEIRGVKEYIDEEIRGVKEHINEKFKQQTENLSALIKELVETRRKSE